MPRLVLLFEYPTLFGGERSALATLDCVRAAGFEVTAIVPDDGELVDTLRLRDVAVLPFAHRDAAGVTQPLAERRTSLEWLLRDVRPSLLHANSLAMGRLSGPVARELCVPSVSHLRDIIGLRRSAIDDLNCHRRLIAVSQATRDFHIGQGVDTEKTVAIHNGVDLDEFRPRPASGYLHRELELPVGAQIVAAIGQIGLRKGLDAWLAAVERIAATDDRAQFLVVGSRHSDKAETRELEERLQAATSRGRLADRLHLLGTRSDVPAFLNEVTVLLHAARQEPLGRVLLEAAAGGVAVVATDVGGTREIFPSETQAARLVAVDDVDAMASSVLGLLNDVPERLSMVSAARLRAEQAFDIRDAAPKIVDVYRSVLEETGGRG